MFGSVTVEALHTVVGKFGIGLGFINLLASPDERVLLGIADLTRAISCDSTTDILFFGLELCAC